MPSLVSDHASQRAVDGASSQPRMLRELAEAQEVFTGSRPMILVLEDLQWSDTATLAWLPWRAGMTQRALC
jgi:predicted ATPase